MIPANIECWLCNRCHRDSSQNSCVTFILRIPKCIYPTDQVPGDGTLSLGQSMVFHPKKRLCYLGVYHYNDYDAS
jgi:hypothetical protein